MPETLITPSRFYGTASSDSRAQSVRTRFWIGDVGLLTICFIGPLVKLASFATQSDLHSHRILIPVIVVYLFYFGRERAAVPTRAAFVPGVMFGAVGVAAVISALNIFLLASTFGIVDV